MGAACLPDRGCNTRGPVCGQRHGLRQQSIWRVRNTPGAFGCPSGCCNSRRAIVPHGWEGKNAVMLTPWTRPKERAFGGGPVEPLGTAQARPGLQQAPRTPLGSGDPPGGEDSLGAEPPGWCLPSVHLGPRLWSVQPLPKDTGSGDPQQQGEAQSWGGHSLEVSKLLEDGP